MVLYAAIGAKALYLLFVWLISAALASWLSDRKGYGERVGLTFGLLLSAVGLAIVLLLPGRPGSRWKVEGWVPRRTAPQSAAPAGVSPRSDGPGGASPGSGGPAGGEEPSGEPGETEWPPGGSA